MITNSSPPKPASQIDPARIAAEAGGELFQDGIAAVVAVGVVDLFEVVDVGDQDRQGAAALQGFSHQCLEMAFHVAAVVQAGQSVGDGELDALLEAVAQEVGVALALDLGLDAREQLVALDRPDDVVVDAHVEAAQQARLVAGLDQNDDRQMPRAIERAHLRAQPQAVGVRQAQADDQQIEIVLGDLQQRLLRIALDDAVMDLGQAS